MPVLSLLPCFWGAGAGPRGRAGGAGRWQPGQAARAASRRCLMGFQSSGIHRELLSRKRRSARARALGVNPLGAGEDAPGVGGERSVSGAPSLHLALQGQLFYLGLGF